MRRNIAEDRLDDAPLTRLRPRAGLIAFFVARQDLFNSEHTTRNEFETMRLRSTLFELDGTDK